MRSRTQGIVEWVAFQIVWFVCAVGAASGCSAPGVTVAVAFVGVVLVTRRGAWTDCATVLVSGAAGFIAETVLIASGLVRFAAPWPSGHVAPAWIVALWLAFGATLAAMASWLGDRFVLKAFVIGLLGGPLAYWAGARLGALEITPPVTRFYLASALLWAVTLPALLYVRSRLQLLRPER